MKKITFTALFTLLYPFSAHAALPPEAQRIVELREILNQEELYTSFPHHSLVDNIEYVEQDRYRISAGKCRMDALIKDSPILLPMPGPRKFHVVFENMKCEGLNKTE